MRPKLMLAIIFSVIFYSSLCSQSSTWTYIKKYSQVNLNFDINFEFPIVLLGKPFTIENVRDYVESELNAAGINYTLKSDRTETPVLVISEGDNGRASDTYNDCDCNCHYTANAESYYVELRIIDNIDGDRIITYQRLNNIITVGTGGRAISAWDEVKGELKAFIEDWKQTH